MDRSEILEHMARALYVSSYADACEDEEAFGDLDFDRSEAAGAGEDWMNTLTSETPTAATEKADEIAADFEARNGRTLTDAAEEWARVLTAEGCGRYPADADHFGHYLAMQSLGHGVGLWDDCRKPEGSAFETGYFEFYAWDWA